MPGWRAKHMEKIHPEEYAKLKTPESQGEDDEDLDSDDDHNSINDDNDADTKDSSSQQLPSMSNDDNEDMTDVVSSQYNENEIRDNIQTFITQLNAASNSAETDGRVENIVKVAVLLESFHKEVRENQQLGKYLQETLSPADHELEFIRALKITEKWRLSLKEGDLCDILVKLPGAHLRYDSYLHSFILLCVKLAL